MYFQKYLQIVQQHMFSIVSYLMILLYMLIIFGLYSNAPLYLDIIQYYLKIYISLFLIIRFNPFRNIKFTDFDSKIAFDAGIFLLASILGTSINIQYVTNYIKNV